MSAVRSNALARNRIDAATRAIHALSRRSGPGVVRAGFAIVFIVFGALKLVGTSPVSGMLEAMFPWAPPGPLVAGLGLAEIALGAALLAFPRSVLVPVILIGHLAGTFLAFVLAPEWIFAGGVLHLSTEGEFVMKNLILIGALLMLIARSPGERRVAEVRGADRRSCGGPRHAAGSTHGEDSRPVFATSPRARR